ncbi:MAG: hypothetical protein UX17_C0016G0012 [Parcubacteria group bacterium GW2011_GWC2_45_7]|nr:MAG: hypothetical protein UX17_C0016G0012 [Parcubacteria group bacterium GW2011_GWC2_45_7]
MFLCSLLAGAACVLMLAPIAASKYGFTLRYLTPILPIACLLTADRLLRASSRFLPWAWLNRCLAGSALLGLSWLLVVNPYLKPAFCAAKPFWSVTEAEKVARYFFEQGWDWREIQTHVTIPGSPDAIKHLQFLDGVFRNSAGGTPLQGNFMLIKIQREKLPQHIPSSWQIIKLDRGNVMVAVQRQGAPLDTNNATICSSALNRLAFEARCIKAAIGPTAPNTCEPQITIRSNDSPSEVMLQILPSQQMRVQHGYRLTYTFDVNISGIDKPAHFFFPEDPCGAGYPWRFKDSSGALLIRGWVASSQVIPQNQTTGQLTIVFETPPGRDAVPPRPQVIGSAGDDRDLRGLLCEQQKEIQRKTKSPSWWGR